MMHKEFEEIAGYEVSYEDYTNIIEPMYMATNLSKQEFVKVIDKKRFALPTKGQIVKQMKKIANEIFEGCGLTTYHKEEAELEKIAKQYAKRFYGLDWVNDIKSYVYFNKECAYCGYKMDRGCSFPSELVIGRDGCDYERIVLVK